MKKYYKKPNGELTRNADEYIDSWRNLAEPVAKALECQLSAYDPDFQFCDKQGCFSMPSRAVKNLNFALQRNAVSQAIYEFAIDASADFDDVSRAVLDAFDPEQERFEGYFDDNYITSLLIVAEALS
jgi:hypothetical protein